ncbi:hypothetical protein CALCODRAFT_515433 [Calocera cornea HHB12733]|uniref:DUF3835 domain-containing protein n=1 Tax=Calocera cornea HHB12733 TaxID=1353952 RepID=A0A165IEK7_9BASI|nr:hypothetical protein CALCODRAFT_515433 [Calocera cornea HHB12733]
MSATGPAEESKTKAEINGLAQLLSSLDLKTAGNSQVGAKPIDATAAQALAEKLNQILGEDAGGPVVKRNEKGQVLNEEGLPVIDITEPDVPNRPTPPLPGIPQVTVHIPLSTLTDAQKEERRRKVDRILDELEREEEEAEMKKQALAEMETAEIRRREKERAMENMAKALAATNRLSRQAAPVAQARPTPSPQFDATESLPAAPPPQLQRQPSKKVKFSDEALKEPKVQEEPVAMGDVVMGGLRRKSDPSAALADQPLKLYVVERTPGKSSAGSGAKVQVVEDSDDETDGDEDEAQLFSIQPEDHDEPEDDEDVDEDEDEDPEGFESGEDFDSAMLQRDAAAVYYSKRGDLRAGTGAFAGFGQIAVPAEDWDPEEVDTFGPGERKKPVTVSRFKSARVAQSFLDPNVLPPGIAVQDKDLVGLVRQGKLDNDGELVVIDEEAEDDNDLGPRGHEMIEALRRGESTLSSQAAGSTSKPSPLNSVIQPVAIPTPPSAEPADSPSQPKVSKFKAARQAVGGTASSAPAPTELAQTAERQTRKAALSSAVMERTTKSSAATTQLETQPPAEPTAAPLKASRFKARRGGA